jgi:hypothetical protein
MIARRPKRIARRERRSFDRAERQSGKWLLAMSLACPRCTNRLWGDGEYVWCESYDCDFYCAWSEVDHKAFSFNKSAPPSQVFRALTCHKECRQCPLR